MRLPLLALLCCGTAAFCQAPAPQKIDPDKMFQMPEKFSQQAPDLGTLGSQAFRWNDSTILARPTIDTPNPKLNDPQIDPKIIVHPPWHGGSNGQDVAHHLYPNLKFLPLHRSAQNPR